MNDESLKYLPPQNLEIEASIISRLIINPGDMDIISDLITPDDFYKTAHRVIFTACLELFNSKEPIDLVSIAEKLREKKELEQIGGAAFLSKISDCPMAVSIEHACRKIREKASLRRIIVLCNEYSMRAFEDNGDVETVIDEAQRDRVGAVYQSGCSQ